MPRSALYLPQVASRFGRRPVRALLAVFAMGMLLFSGHRDVVGFSWFTVDGWAVTWPTSTDRRWLSASTFQPGSPIERAVLGARP